MNDDKTPGPYIAMVLVMVVVLVVIGHVVALQKATGYDCETQWPLIWQAECEPLEVQP